MSTELNEAEMEDSKALSLVLTLQYHLVVNEPYLIPRLQMTARARSCRTVKLGPIKSYSQS